MRWVPHFSRSLRGVGTSSELNIPKFGQCSHPAGGPSFRVFLQKGRLVKCKITTDTEREIFLFKSQIRAARNPN